MGNKKMYFHTNTIMCSCLDYQLCGLGYNKSEKVICCYGCIMFESCDMRCQNNPLLCNGAYMGRCSNERVYVFETYHHKRFFLGTDEVKEFFGCSRNNVYQMLNATKVIAPSGVEGKLFLLE